MLRLAGWKSRWPSSRMYKVIFPSIFFSPPRFHLAQGWVHQQACVSISYKTLTTYLGSPLSKYNNLAERAFDIARHTLGRHVGKQDEYAAAFGGLNYISFNPDGTANVEPLNLDATILRDLQSNLMLFFTGSSHHSWSILEEQEKSTRSQLGSTVGALHEVKEHGVKMRNALVRGDLSRFRYCT